ncbi:MAG: DNA polymerase [Jatrophihabitantaceae bacterium]
MSEPGVDVGGTSAVLADLMAHGVGPGDWIGLAVASGIGVGLAAGAHVVGRACADPVDLVAQLESALHPRWIWWDARTPASLAAGGLRAARCWDVAAVHRLLFGGWRAAPDVAWASLHGLPIADLPTTGQLDLLGLAGDDGPDLSTAVRPDGYLRPEWVSDGWARSADRLADWARTAAIAAARQLEQLRATPADGDPLSTAWSESAAEMLCTELQADGLPIDRDRAEQLIAASAGPRPRDEADATRIRAERDAAVLAHVPGARGVDLRNPAQVRAMLATIGFELPDTRSWRLEPFRRSHPVIGPLLAWRKAERISTTYGYGWLEANVGTDGRLRGGWTGSDGAAGRMTAQAGLHNLPAELRPAVAAEPGHVLVRADLGQIEPRVLAVVSGDAAFARAGLENDLYAPVAARLGVERPIAKVAVLAAMYGQTSGSAGEALKGMQAAYPDAMRYLDAAYDEGRAGRGVRTHGGRLVRMPALPEDLDEAGVRSAQAARGRYARNAVIQGAAAEFFKTWAVIVRARAAALDARIVLCLHDELLVHAPRERADAVADLLRVCLNETAGRWQAGHTSVRFVADISVLERWSDAKPVPAPN